MIQESEFQTIASDTVHGLAGRVAKESSSAPTMKFRNQRTFFGDAKDSVSCRNSHVRCVEKSTVYGAVLSLNKRAYQIVGIHQSSFNFVFGV